MRPFYIIKNKHGFYSVSFVNQETGERLLTKALIPLIIARR